MNLDTLKIEKLQLKDWQEQRRLKLAFAKNNPQATCADFKQESKLTDVAWQQYLKDLLDNGSVIFIAKLEDKIVGMAGVSREKSPKCHHVAIIFNVYVEEEYQGKGIGKMLIQELMDDTKKDPTLAKFNLDVTTTQESAINLYKRLGFEIVGELKKEYKVNGKFYDVYEMEKYL